MENASDAIIMAGAMLIFVIAITVAMTVFSQARATIDTVVYASDETNYYEYLNTSRDNNVKNRIVGLETVIPTLYKYYKENYTVVFLKSDGNPLHLYDTQTNAELWSGNEYDNDGTVSKYAPIISKYYGSDSTERKKVCSFDVDEETARHEPWTGSSIDYKNNLDAFLQGGVFYYPSGTGDSYDYKLKNDNSFVKEYADEKFIETIGEYSTTNINANSLSIQLNQGIRNNNNKMVIVYQLTN